MRGWRRCWRGGVGIIELTQTAHLLRSVHPGTATRHWHHEFARAGGRGTIKPVGVSRVGMVLIPLSPHPVDIGMVQIEDRIECGNPRNSHQALHLARVPSDKNVHIVMRIAFKVAERSPWSPM